MRLFGSKTPDVNKLFQKQDYRGLLKALSYKDDPAVRESAASALGMLGGKVACNGLALALKDSEELVRRKAMHSLGMIGNVDAINSLFSANSVEGLVFILTSNRMPEMKVKAIEALAKIGDNNAVDGLISCLKNEDSTVHLAARAALCTIRGNDFVIADVTDTLLISLQNSDPYVRARAAVKLGEIGNDRAVGGLVKALRDSAWVVRNNAITALSKIKGNHIAETLIAALKIETSKTARLGLIEVLSKIENTLVLDEMQNLLKTSTNLGELTLLLMGIGDERAFNSLIATLKKGTLRVKKSVLVEAAGVVFANSGDRVVERLQLVTKDPDPNVARFAIKTLIEIQRIVGKYDKIIEKSAQDSMLCLKDWDLGKREAAEKRIRSGEEPLARLYAFLWDKKIVEAYKLVQLYPDLQNRIREYANMSISPYEDPALLNLTCYSAKKVMRKIETDGYMVFLRMKRQPESIAQNIDCVITAIAPHELVKLGKPAVEPLIQKLKQTNSLHQRIAAYVLGEIGDVRAVKPLILKLNDSDVDVRSYAAEALGKLGDIRAVEPLTQISKDKDESVRKAAEEALEKIHLKIG
jgi:HEAT repeat protein